MGSGSEGADGLAKQMVRTVNQSQFLQKTPDFSNVAYFCVTTAWNFSDCACLFLATKRVASRGRGVWRCGLCRTLMFLLLFFGHAFGTHVRSRSGPQTRG